MMLDRMGIIGKQHGVRDSSSPKPKKLATSNQKLAFLNNCAMRPDSSSLNFSLAAPVALVAIGVVAGSGNSSLSVCLCGG